jgi:PAS domain S-box-containing protein
MISPGLVLEASYDHGLAALCTLIAAVFSSGLSPFYIPLGIAGIGVAVLMMLGIPALTAVLGGVYEQRAPFDELFEQTPEAIALTSIDDRVIRVNREFTRVFGYTPQEAFGHLLGELIVPEESREEYQRHLDLMARGQRVEAEGVRRRKDGSRLQAAIVRAPVPMPDGQFAVYAMFRDITNRKQAQAELTKQKEILQKIFDHIPVMIRFRDVDGRICLVNHEWECTLGWSLEEIEQQNLDVFAELYPDPREYQRVQQGIAEASGEWADCKTRTKEGRVIDTTWASVRLSDGTMIGIGRDISKRKRAEESSREAEGKYQDIFDQVEEGIYQTTPEGRFVLVNPGLVRMLGFDSPEELIGAGNISPEQYVEPGKRGEFKSLLAEHGAVRHFEYQAYRKDGSTIWVSDNARAVRDEKGAIVCYSGFVRDITERKRAEIRSAAFAALARRLSGARTPSDAATIIADTADELFGWDACTVDLYSANTDLIQPVLEVDTILGQRVNITQRMPSRPPSPLGRRVIDHGPKLILREEPVRFDEEPVPFGDESRPSAAIMMVPILHAADVIGVLSFQSYCARAYDDTALDDLQALAEHCDEALNRISAEMEWHSTEERYRDLVENSHELICTHDLDGAILSANRAALEILGYDPSRTRNISEILAPAVRNQFDDYIARLRRDGCASGVMLVQTGSGERRIWEYHNTLRTEGVVAPIVRGMARDITERKLAEKKLRTSEAQLAEAQHLVHIGSWNLDLKTNISTWSDELYRIYGLDPETVTASCEAFIERVHQEDRGLVTMALRKCLTDHKPFSYQRRVVRPDGEVRVVYAHGSLEYGRDGNPIRMFGTTQDITEQKRTEDAQREAERKYREIFENAGEGIFQTTPEGRFITANPAMAHMLGFGSSWELIAHRKDIAQEVYVEAGRREEAKRWYEEQGEGRGFESEVFRKDGSKIWVSVHARAVRDEGRTVLYYEGTMQDITERKQAEAALRESEERYRDLVENSREFICTHDLNGVILSANRAASEVFGYDLKDCGGKKNYRDLLVPEVRDLFDDYLARIRRDGFASGLTLVQTSSGQRLILEYHNTLRTEGVATTIVRGMARDITEQRRAEKALRESEERYRELYENAREAIYVHDLNGHYTSVNRAAEELSGYTRDEILGTHYSRFVAPEYLDLVRDRLCKKLRDGDETTYEVEVIAKDGRRVPVEVSSRLIYENGELAGMQGMVVDITERKRAREVLQSYARRLMQAQEAERQRIARELHDEIGQVLTAVKINLQAVQRLCGTNASPSPLIESVAIVDEALGRVRDLSLELRPSLLDDLGLPAALRWYLDGYTQRTGIASEVVSDLDEGKRLPRELETACFRIAQEALTNIARHAQASRVSLQLRRSPREVLLAIEDNGIGFDVDHLLKRASSAAALGLRGMQERALAVGGRVKIDSAFGRKTIVRGCFPLKRKQ